ncbi:LysR family transcriptional regulator [Bradyrhizobium viridifuturi]|uniref:LysR substrate-binding domain-containing protein n=1 Tax=Bradyrhizobium viridifuturi TaxID=1654716 RepID=UPI000B90EBE5|nr:LysR family transcriptional regulator [Bradyrhizobium viridifuturi]
MAARGETSERHHVTKRVAIDLQQLRFAIAACDCGSLRRAADLLSVQHSLVSRSISQLEHSIGVTLFERSSNGVTATPAGRNVLRTARIILEQVDTLTIGKRSNFRAHSSLLSVGFFTSLSAGGLRATLIEFKRRFPRVKLTTAERSRSRLTAALRNGALDVLIVAGDAPMLDSQVLPLWDERIMVSLPEDHHLASREVVNWTDLRNENVLLSHYDPGRDLEDLLMSKLLLAKDGPKIERHDVSRGIIKSLISMDLGIGLALESDTGNFANLVYRELRDEIGPIRMRFFARWRADNENPALNCFLKVLAERYSLPASSD